MKITFDNNDIPEWLKPHMKMFCECGSPIADDGPIDYNGVMKLTQRWCMNPHCPYHMAQKIEMLAKYFNIDGVGAATGLDMALGYRFRNHLQALAYWFTSPPEVHLYEVGELAYIYGVSTKWKDWLAGYTSFAEYFSLCDDIPEVILNNKEYLFECEKYFKVKQERMNRSVLYVMLTGSMHGFSSRAEFLDSINETYKDYFRVEDNKKTIRDTFCLIKEPESVDYSKTQIAVSNNIPIMSSLEFLSLLRRMKEELDKEAQLC